MIIANQIIPYRELFHNAPVAAALLDAKTLKLEAVNTKMLDLWGREKAILGSEILDFMPEIADQEFPLLLKKVGQTGRAHEDFGALVVLEKEGKMQRLFMDYSYSPILNDKKTPIAILILGSDISEKQLNALAGEEYTRNLRAMVLSAPVAMCIYRGHQLKVECVNNLMLDLWQDQQQRRITILNYVYFTGMPMQFNDGGISYSCTALRDAKGNSSGCILIASKD